MLRIASQRREAIGTRQGIRLELEARRDQSYKLGCPSGLVVLIPDICHFFYTGKIFGI